MYTYIYTYIHICVRGCTYIHLRKNAHHPAFVDHNCEWESHGFPSGLLHVYWRLLYFIQEVKKLRTDFQRLPYGSEKLYPQASSESDC